jgi:NAD(P)-dependent dehydrogenase (short-subunit alcohol dehydrogenase family)
MRRATGCPDISVAPLDLADLRSVKAFADAWHGPLHILVNNAGIMVVALAADTGQYCTPCMTATLRMLLWNEASCLSRYAGWRAAGYPALRSVCIGVVVLRGRGPALVESTPEPARNY